MRNQVISTWKPKVLKENKTTQRSDVSLTKEIASTLVQMIFSGQSLFPKTGYITLTLEGQEKPINLLTTTLNKWVTRNNVIPETGETLRNILNEAREQYRINEREKRTEKMLDRIEREFCDIMSLRTSVPAIGTTGIIKDLQMGKILCKEDVNLLRIKIDTAKFLAERLDPQRYGKNINKKHLPLTFSLAELRKAKEEMQEVENK